MKTFSFFWAFLFIVIPQISMAAEGGFGIIDLKGLEALISAKTPMILVDARDKKWQQGQRIPGAKTLIPTASDEEIRKTLPDLSALIVVYCGGGSCPSSKNLAIKLVGLGYKNIIDFADGMQGWIAANKPTEKVEG